MIALLSSNIQFINDCFNNNTLNNIIQCIDLEKNKELDIYVFNNSSFKKIVETRIYFIPEIIDDEYIIKFVLDKDKYPIDCDSDYLLFHINDSYLKTKKSTIIEYTIIYNDYIVVSFSGKEFYEKCKYGFWY